MPTITAIAWDRLLDRESSPAPEKSASPPPTQAPPPVTSYRISPPAAVASYRISPALYAATDTSVEEEGGDSPFVVNRKRWRDRPAVVEEGVAEGVGETAAAEEVEVVEEEEDEFLDPRETMSVASSSDAEDAGSGLRMIRTPFGGLSEFYDASADFSDGSASHSSSSYNRNTEMELRALRINLLEEIEKRKGAEESLIYMQGQWQKMAKALQQVGFTSPETQHSESMHQIDPISLCQEIVASKFVMEAVERGIARAETEIVLGEVVETKNHEISRLRDRLQYYEAMNREMSQRNQEVVETARQQRLKRRKMQRWMWSGVSLAFTLGAGFFAYSYLSQSSVDPSSTCVADVASVTTDSENGAALKAE